MYFVCVVCPPDHVALPHGYGLTTPERNKLAARMCGIPITVQHANIHAVAAKLTDAQVACPSFINNTVDSAGHVVSAWVDAEGGMWAVFEIDNDLTLTLDLIDKGHLGAVSLTHLESSAMPIELSLCSAPARPGATIKMKTAELKDALAYKAATERTALKRKTLQAAMETPAPPTNNMSAIETILAALDPKDRALVQERFADMIKAVDSARSSESDAIAAKKRIEKVTSVDKKLMQHELDHLLKFFSEEDKSLYVVGNDTMFDALKECPPGAIQSVSNLIKCASANMARLHQLSSQKAPATLVAASVTRTEMKTVEETPEEEPARGAKRTFDESKEDDLSPLQRAMANQFV